MSEFKKIFKKVNGFSVIKNYIKARVLSVAIIQVLVIGTSKKALEILRLSTQFKIQLKLKKKYKYVLEECDKKEYDNLERKRSNKVWVCWLQGIDNAPDIVQQCYKSMQENLTDKEIILITEDSYKDYVDFPNIIQKKIDNSIIPPAQKSDLIRLELLIKYGGTWMDSTVYCSGKKYPQYMFNSELFLFQNLKPGLDGHCTSISNWFITSCTNHPILLLVRELLFNYWEKNNKLIDYFIFHDFFQLAIETYPDEWNKVIPFSNSVPHILLLRLFNKYDENIWNAVKDMTCFHKLTYKFTKEEENLKNTYYDFIIKKDYDSIKK